MSISPEVTTNLQVARIASKYFPCSCDVIKESNGKGSRGYRLIVGWKLNHAYDPNANPNRPDLTPEMRAVETNRANPQEADVRIIWLKPGSTEEDLKEILQRIKKDLEKVKVIPEKDSNVTGINSMISHKSDADIAAEVAAGKYQQDDKDDDQESIPVGYFDNKSDEEIENEMNELSEDTPEDPELDEEEEIVGTQSSNKLDKALGEIVAAIQAIDKKISNIDERVDKIETRKPTKLVKKVKKVKKVAVKPEQQETTAQA